MTGDQPRCTTKNPQPGSVWGGGHRPSVNQSVMAGGHLLPLPAIYFSHSASGQNEIRLHIDHEAMTSFVRKGECNRCGDCCKPRYDVDEDAKEFYRKNGLPENGQCQFLALVDGLWTCTEYANRAPFCQAFPWHPDQIVGRDRCSYTFEVVEDDQPR